MSKHTPGNWQDIKGKASGRIVVSLHQSRARRNVASCGGPDREANARLLAAAPDLLAYVQAHADTGCEDALELIAKVGGGL